MNSVKELMLICYAKRALNALKGVTYLDYSIKSRYGGDRRIYLHYSYMRSNGIKRFWTVDLNMHNEFSKKEVSDNIKSLLSLFGHIEGWARYEQNTRKLISKKVRSEILQV